MFGFNRNQPVNNSPAKTVKLVKDSTGSSAVNLQKIEHEGGVSLKKKTEAAGVSLSKRNMAGIRAQVVVVLDHSGSMWEDYETGKVQDLTERFLGFGLQVDVDGEIPVIPFDSYVKNTVNVNLSNYQNVVKNKIYEPDNMGGTNLKDALLKVKELAMNTDAPIFCAVVTDGEPFDRNGATQVVKDLANYPVFIKFLAVKPVKYLQELDDLDASQRLLDNVDTKNYTDLSSVTDEQFADDMADEWDTWTQAAFVAGILTQ